MSEQHTHMQSSDNEFPETVPARLPRRIITVQQHIPRALTPPPPRRSYPFAICEGVPTLEETLSQIRLPKDPFENYAFRDMNSSIPTLPQPRDIRSSGPLTRSSRRQSTPSITFSNTPPNIFPMADEIKTEKRPRITPTTGPLTIFGEESVPKIRGFKVKTES